ncbi:MAG: hypothetical protein OQK24_13105 [Magnetovibrio sp.]|nr:hypothetical protein [Magnetovibrio sp.]
MPPDPHDVLEFKQALSKTPVEVITKKLNDNVIMRSWKRELAEAEVARRGGQTQKANSRSSAIQHIRHSSAEVASWILAIVMVFVAIVVGVAAIY